MPLQVVRHMEKYDSGHKMEGVSLWCFAQIFLLVLQSQAQSNWAGPTYNLQGVHLLQKATPVCDSEEVGQCQEPKPGASICCIAAALDHTSGDVAFDMVLS